jgi:hypothetical protein
MQQVGKERFLGIEDEGVAMVMGHAAKALSEAYGTFYDPPQNLPGGWVGIRVDVRDTMLRVVPKSDVGQELQRRLDLFTKNI